MRRYRSRSRYTKTRTPESSISIFERRVLASEIVSILDANGFTRCRRLETKYGDNSEVVFAKPLSENSRYLIVVYTSCNQAGGAFIARRKGKDAIRVAGLYIKKDGSTVGIIKNTRVNRTSDAASICERMMKRVTSSFLELKEYSGNKDSKCKHCAAPTFTSLKGNQVCSEFCWRRNER
mgnify:CR=1 FL=1